jgi:hypothetical protein
MVPGRPRKPGRMGKGCPPPSISIPDDSSFIGAWAAAR